MLSSLAADQLTSGLNATFRNARNDLGDLLGVILAAGDIVKEQKRLRAAADDVVDAHGNAVDTDGVMLVHHHGKFELGADAVRTGDENRMLDPGQVKSKHSAEAADLIDTGAGLGSGDVRLHQFNGFITCGYVNTRSFIAFAVAFHQFYSFPSGYSPISLLMTS